MKYLSAIFQSWFGPVYVFEVDSASLLLALKKSGYKATLARGNVCESIG